MAITFVEINKGVIGLTAAITYKELFLPWSRKVGLCYILVLHSVLKPAEKAVGLPVMVMASTMQKLRAA